MKTFRIGLAGNPNCGKTTIFNALTGLRQRVGNYAGVTVEKEQGTVIYQGHHFILTDLPGTYSLAASSLDETIACDFLLNHNFDIVVNVLDASNLERQLFLTLQLIELELPLVVNLNRIDLATKRGYHIDDKKLTSFLGVPVVRADDFQKQRFYYLLDQVLLQLKHPLQPPFIPYLNELDAEVQKLVSLIRLDPTFLPFLPARWLALALLENNPYAVQKLSLHCAQPTLQKQLEFCAQILKQKTGQPSGWVVSEARYATVDQIIRDSCTKEPSKRTISELLDAVLLHPVAGLPIFLGFLWGIFQLTFTLGAYPQEWLRTFFEKLAQLTSLFLPEGLVQSLLIDGILGGVGAVLSFMPLVIILFFFIFLMEDTGYMARVTSLMNKSLRAFGLPGQAFIPMLMGFGCSVPAIMATRTLKSLHERIITVLVIPFMSCGAKLPVYVLLAGAFFAENQASVVLSLYLIGVVLALIVSFVLHKTILKGKKPAFVMELPAYQKPKIKNEFLQLWNQVVLYFRKAGTTIMTASILIWAATTFPQAPEGTNEQQAMMHSFCGQAGQVIEPLLRPLGFDWKLGIAILTGFAAKEVVISTLGVLYRATDVHTNQEIQKSLQTDPIFTPLVAYNFMLLVLILAPCVAALSAIRSELGKKWLAFYLVFSVSLSWLICFMVFQIGSLLGK